jgi:hypothetical protein
MKFHNLVYTKVSPEDSSWKKTGFHTAFYPLDFMTKEDVFEIESKIHFPTDSELNNHKLTVFYQTIQDDLCLIVLSIRPLKEAKDSFGRGGIFLCHGLIFPSTLWKQAVSPLSLFDLVKDSIFQTREEALASPLSDKKTGDIKPLEINEQRLNRLSSSLPSLANEFERQMALLLNRIARAQDRPSVVVKGEPERVSELMDKLFAFMPDALKVSMGWDSAFDGGTFTYFPLKIAGFTAQQPTGGNRINVDLERQRIEQTPETAKFFNPETSYEKWLADCGQEAVSKQTVEGVYRLSLFLEQGLNLTQSDSLPDLTCFAGVNKDKITSLFIKRSESLVGEPLSRLLENRLAPTVMLELLIDDFPPEKLSKLLADIILDNRLTQKDIKKRLPDRIVKASDLLALLSALWEKDVLPSHAIEAIDKTRRIEFIRYLVVCGWLEKDWLLSVLRNDEKAFNALLSSHETRAPIHKTLLKIIAKHGEAKAIKDAILEKTLAEGKGFLLFHQESLEAVGFDNEMIARIKEENKGNGLAGIIKGLFRKKDKQ